MDQWQMLLPETKVRGHQVVTGRMHGRGVVAKFDFATASVSDRVVHVDAIEQQSRLANWSLRAHHHGESSTTDSDVGRFASR